MPAAFYGGHLANPDSWPLWAEKFRAQADVLRSLSVKALKAQTGLGERKVRKLYAFLREGADAVLADEAEEQSANYEHNKLTDEYVYYIPKRARPLILSGSTVRATSLTVAAEPFQFE